MTNQPIAVLRHIARSFPGPPGVLAVDGVSLDICAGDYLSIMGPSGSGKSTLLNLLGLLDRPTLGSYELGGVDSTVLSDKERSRLRATMLGFVFQAFHLLPDRSVFENVILGMAYSGVGRSGRVERAERALAEVSMTHRSEFRPGTLSGGERQRVAIARAIATRPPILLADEPTGNLDQGTSTEILDMLGDLHDRGLTLIVVTHDPTVAARSTRAFVMRDGRLVDGP
ncbi:MAG: ABC transporter ATP-binding protein [Micropruina sp.]|uniref:ABC transporter ATP-binding protein n=1 Tax=Micropruina sp. TaxID=2737536 RepID=UPI0039E612D4